MGLRLEVSEILDRVLSGDTFSKSQLETAVQAAALLRKTFLEDAFTAIGRLTPNTTDFEAFKKCLKSVTDLLVKAGFITIPETQLMWMRIEEVERS